MLLHTFAGIAWDPQIRGFLAVGVGVVILMGSVLLLLSTNLGNRLAFLLASAALFGWMAIMGGVWFTYGTIGMLGEIPHWEVLETAYPGTGQAALDEAHSLSTEELPPAEELNEMAPADLDEVKAELEATTGGWRLLPESNPSFGEAKAAVDEYFKEHPDEELKLEAADDYIATYSFERGGKKRLPDDPSRWDRIKHKVETIAQLTHPPRYAIIQVHPVVEQEAEPGQAPPTPKADDDKPTVSVIMQRDLGDRRFPGLMLMTFSGIMFAVLCVQLHKRDQRVAAARAAGA